MLGSRNGSIQKVHHNLFYVKMTRWGIFQGQYLPRLSRNYVTINKDLQRLPPQLYYTWRWNLLWSVLQWHRSCYSNKMTPLLILLAALFLGTEVHRSFFVQYSPLCLLSLSKESVIETFWDEVFMVRNTVKNGESWCSAVIWRKRSAFEIQLYLMIVVSIFLKRSVKDYGYSFGRLQERRIWLVCIKALLLAVL